MGIGISYMCPIIAGWEYFPNNKGLVSGLIVGGYGFGSFIFGFISLAVANPEGRKPDYEVAGGKIFAPEDDISDNAPKMIRFNCLLWAIMYVIAVIFMKRKAVPQLEEVVANGTDSQPLMETADDIDEEHASEEIRRSTLMLTRDPTFKESVLSLRALHIWLMMVLSSGFPLYLASSFKSYGLIDIPDDTFMTIVGSVGAALNGVSRVFWATLFDYFGFKFVYISLVSIEVGIAFTFVLIHKVKALYLIWVCVSFTCLGGHFSLFPSLSAKVFGPRSGGLVYSFLFSAFATTTIINWLLSKQSSNGNIQYKVLFYILGGTAIGALALAVIFKETSVVKKEAIPKDVVDINKTPATISVTDQ